MVSPTSIRLQGGLGNQEFLQFQTSACCLGLNAIPYLGVAFLPKSGMNREEFHMSALFSARDLE